MGEIRYNPIKATEYMLTATERINNFVYYLIPANLEVTNPMKAESYFKVF